LSNGVMRDIRVFHINVPNWIEMYNKQGDFVPALRCEIALTEIKVEFEATATQAWNVEGLETIKESSQKRLKEKGWNNLRPALSVTVRCVRMHFSFEKPLSYSLQRMDNERFVRGASKKSTPNWC